MPIAARHVQVRARQRAPSPCDTGRTGAAAKAGHNLLLHVTGVGGDARGRADDRRSSLVLDADATSLRVREGTGGMQALDDDDKANIEQTIDDEILQGQAIDVPLDLGRAWPQTAAGSRSRAS